jgi:NAD-dependent DNA ligase
MNEVKVPYLLLKLNDKQLEEKINNQYTEWKKDFEIDGIVIDINDYKLRDLLGREENNNPAFARAFKNPDWCAVENTVVNNIKYSVSKQGFIKPVIEINPVIIGGAEISNVTGNNMKYLIENNIFKGSVIEIIRSGDVIPKHINTISFVKENIINLDKCPCCGSETIWNETNVELCCTNINCPERLLNGLIFFFLIIEIDNFGEGEIKKLFNLGYDTPEKILNISYNELNSIEGWAEKSVNSLFKQFNNLKEVGLPLAQLMQALDLFEGKLGKKVAQKIFDNSNNDFTIDNLIKIDGVSDITGNVFIKALNEYNNRYKDFPIKISYITSQVKELVGDKYNNTNICMTGFRDKELEEFIINNGGKIASGVSKATTHLLVKDKDSSSSKTDKAKSLSIPILTKEEFLNL